MEADWEVELDGESPVIDVQWRDFIDLREASHRARLLPEALLLPALGEVLVRLNTPPSTVWTAKCDVWPVDTADSGVFDPDELDAPFDSATRALACYIDLLPSGDHQFESLESAVKWCRTVCRLLHSSLLRCCRADLIIRHTFHAREDRVGLGVTAYFTACGSGAAAAASALAHALSVAADGILAAGPPAEATAKFR
jgi:hypothetical protein